MLTFFIKAIAWVGMTLLIVFLIVLGLSVIFLPAGILMVVVRKIMSSRTKKA